MLENDTQRPSMSSETAAVIRTTAPPPSSPAPIHVACCLRPFATWLVTSAQSPSSAEALDVAQLRDEVVYETGPLAISAAPSKQEGRLTPALTCDLSGADDGIRTRDPHLGKVVLYQLSHVR